MCYAGTSTHGSVFRVIKLKPSNEQHNPLGYGGKNENMNYLPHVTFCNSEWFHELYMIQRVQLWA